MLTKPPFRRGPLLLMRQPAVLAAIVGTAAILSMVAALTPLFLSSASSEALQRELGGRCSASFGGQTINFAPIPIAREALDDAVADDPVLGKPRIYLEGTLVDGQNANGEGARTPIRFVGRDEFRDHIELVEGEHGSGVYIDEYARQFMDLRPGGELMFTPLGGEPHTIQVTAVYKHLYESQRDPYWCSLEQITLRNAQGELPPLIVLVDPEEFADQPTLFDSLFAQYARALGDWEIPVTIEGLTVSDARAAAATLELADEVIHEQGEDVPAFFGQPNLLSDLALVSGRVEVLARALRSSVLPLAGVVILAAVALVAGAGAYWVDRRRNELRYLSAIGLGPPHLAAKAAIEVFPALIVAGVLGWVLANSLVGVVGPSTDVETSARISSAWASGIAVGVALLALAMIVAIRARTVLAEQQRNRKSLSWRVPVLVLAIAAAVGVRLRIGETAVRTQDNELVGFVDPLVLFFPLFSFVAVVLLVSEVVLRVLPRLRTHKGGNASYLAARRVVSAPALVIGLIAGAALPVATLVYASSLTRSATSTVDAKGRTFVGADVATPLYRIGEIPDQLSANSTIVIRSERSILNGETVDVLAIDPQTFTMGAFWDHNGADSLEEILSTVGDTEIGEPLPAIVANGSAASGLMRTRSGDLDVTVLEHVSAFPGTEGDRTLLIVDQEQFLDRVASDEIVVGSRILLWSTGLDERVIEEALTDSGVGFAYTLTADRALDQLKFAAVVWTFDFLEMYAILAGVIAIFGVFLYVDARQRSRNLSYILARRMGLKRSEHVLAGVIEISGLAMLGALAGIVAATAGARSLYAILDPLPGTPPGPRWIGAADLSVLALLAAALVGLLAAMIAQRTADQADAQELLSHND